YAGDALGANPDEIADEVYAGVRWTRDGKALLYAETPIGPIVRTPLDHKTEPAILGYANAADDCGSAIVARAYDLEGVRYERWTKAGETVLFRVPTDQLGSDPRCSEDGRHVVVTIGPAFVVACVNDVYAIDVATGD